MINHKVEVVEWNIADIGESAAQVLKVYQEFPQMGTNSWGSQEEYLRKGINDGVLDEASFLGNGFHLRFRGPKRDNNPKFVNGVYVWEMNTPEFTIDPIPRALAPNETREFIKVNDFLAEYLENTLLLDVSKNPWIYRFPKVEYSWDAYYYDGVPYSAAAKYFCLED